jgi:hypothetical protein
MNIAIVCIVCVTIVRVICHRVRNQTHNKNRRTQKKLCMDVVQIMHVCILHFVTNYRAVRRFEPI